MIDVNNISFHYQGSRHEVFSDFSLSLAPGRIYGLLGKNGTGKSTLLYLISGLPRPESGTVSVDGKESLLRQPEMLQEIFIVPEEYAMPDMSFKAFADMMRTFYPHFSDELLDKCLADFEMPAEPNLKELSMGQKKKVYMSFAIATGTRLLMMDEPTNGLDIPSKALFRKVVASYMTDDRTLIISTHQVHDIESLLDHVVIIDNSRVSSQQFYCRHLPPLRLPLHLTAGDERLRHLCRAFAARQRCHHATRRQRGNAGRLGTALQCHHQWQNCQ